jgi:anaphase-promoting complex subunit 8
MSIGEPRPAVLLAGIALASPHRLETGEALKRLRRLTEAAEVFSALHTDDPFNLASAAPLSDCLFVLGRRAELAALAYRVHATARHRPETAMVLSNHCALKGEHERTVVHLKRALRADPTSATAWTLLGHECMEAKNGAAAVEAYR